MEEQLQQLLEQKVHQIELQVATIFDYIGNPKGELYASANQVHRLEDTVTTHQTSLSTLEKQVQLFQKTLSVYIDELYQQAASQRGTRGTDVQMLVKFTATQVAEAVAKLQGGLEKTIQQLIPIRKLQDLERQLLTKQQSSAFSATSVAFQDERRLNTLETRIGLLEQGRSTTQAQDTIQETPSEHLKELQDRITHLEQQLVKELEKAYKTSQRPGEAGGLLTHLQTRLQLVEQEIQGVRATNQQKLLEGMITTSIQSVRTALEQGLATKSSKEEFQQLDQSIQRVDGFAREVLTGFTRMRQDYEATRQELLDVLSTEKIADFRTLRRDMLTLNEDVKLELTSSRLLSKEFQKINKTLADLRQENREEVSTWLETQLNSVQDTLKIYNDQKMNIIRYQLANEVEKIVKDDFQKFFNKQSIQLIESHVETKLPATIQSQVNQYVKDLELTNKTDYYKLAKDISKNVDGIREAKEATTSLKTQISKQVDMFLQQFEHMGKLLHSSQSEVGKLQKQVQTLTFQVKDLQLSMVTEQRKFETKILDLLPQFASQSQSHLLEQLEQLRQVKEVEVKPAPIQSSNSKHTELVFKSLTKCFYTAIFGTSQDQVDTLGDFDRIPGWDYICFTNLEFPGHRGWTFQKVPLHGDPVLTAKYYKWMSHEVLGDYDVVVWMDGYLSPNPMYSELFKHWIATMAEQRVGITHRPHDVRKCIYDECAAVVEGRRARPETVEAVLRNLEAVRMPKQFGLYDTNVLIKYHKLTMVQLVSEQIWQQLERVCTRDQLAVTLVYHQTQFTNYQLQNLLRAFTKSGDHKRIPAF
jgi:hypothetical protein